MKTLIILSSIMLSACTTTPLGWLAETADRNDPCQRVDLIKTGQYPRWCGAASGTRVVTRDWATNRPLTTSRVER